MGYFDRAMGRGHVRRDDRGFNDKGWLDFVGKPNSEALRVTERFRRPDFGHMQVEITYDDPKSLREAVYAQAQRHLRRRRRAHRKRLSRERKGSGQARRQARG